MVEGKAKHLYIEKGCRMKTAIRMAINDIFGTADLEFREDLFTVTREKLNA